MLLGVIVDVALAGLLLAFVLWWRRVAEGIERFREAREGMAPLLDRLREEVGAAESEVARLSDLARTAIPEARAAAAEAGRLLEELRLVNASGERVADRIEAAARLARAATPAPGARPPAWAEPDAAGPVGLGPWPGAAAVAPAAAGLAEGGAPWAGGGDALDADADAPGGGAPRPRWRATPAAAGRPPARTLFRGRPAASAYAAAAGGGPDGGATDSDAFAESDR